MGAALAIQRAYRRWRAAVIKARLEAEEKVCGAAGWAVAQLNHAGVVAVDQRALQLEHGSQRSGCDIVVSRGSDHELTSWSLHSVWVLFWMLCTALHTVCVLLVICSPPVSTIFVLCIASLLHQARAHLEAAQAQAARAAQLQAVNLGAGMVLDSVTVMRVRHFRALSVLLPGCAACLLACFQIICKPAFLSTRLVAHPRVSYWDHQAPRLGSAWIDNLAPPECSTMSPVIRQCTTDPPCSRAHHNGAQASTACMRVCGSGRGGGAAHHVCGAAQGAGAPRQPGTTRGGCRAPAVTGTVVSLCATPRSVSLPDGLASTQIAVVCMCCLGLCMVLDVALSAAF